MAGENIVKPRPVVNANTKCKSESLPYKSNDLNSVFSHYDAKLGKNISTENKLDGGSNKWNE